MVYLGLFYPQAFPGCMCLTKATKRKEGIFLRNGRGKLNLKKKKGGEKWGVNQNALDLSLSLKVLDSQLSFYLVKPP